MRHLVLGVIAGLFLSTVVLHQESKILLSSKYQKGLLLPPLHSHKTRSLSSLPNNECFAEIPGVKLPPTNQKPFFAQEVKKYEQDNKNQLEKFFQDAGVTETHLKKDPQQKRAALIRTTLVDYTDCSTISCVYEKIYSSTNWKKMSELPAESAHKSAIYYLRTGSLLSATNWHPTHLQHSKTIKEGKLADHLFTAAEIDSLWRSSYSYDSPFQRIFPLKVVYRYTHGEELSVNVKTSQPIINGKIAAFATKMSVNHSAYTVMLDAGLALTGSLYPSPSYFGRDLQGGLLSQTSRPISKPPPKTPPSTTKTSPRLYALLYYNDLHERGHHFDFANNVNKSNTNFRYEKTINAHLSWAEIAGWTRVESFKEGSYRQERLRQQGYATDYAKTTATEDFAESISYYRLQPEHLQAQAPYKYKFIKDMLYSGVEYTTDGALKHMAKSLIRFAVQASGRTDLDWACTEHLGPQAKMHPVGQNHLGENLEIPLCLALQVETLFEKWTHQVAKERFEFCYLKKNKYNDVIEAALRPFEIWVAEVYQLGAPYYQLVQAFNDAYDVRNYIDLNKISQTQALEKTREAIKKEFMALASSTSLPPDKQARAFDLYYAGVDIHSLAQSTRTFYKRTFTKTSDLNVAALNLWSDCKNASEIHPATLSPFEPSKEIFDRPFLYCINGNINIYIDKHFDKIWSRLDTNYYDQLRKNYIYDSIRDDMTNAFLGSLATITEAAYKAELIWVGSKLPLFEKMSLQELDRNLPLAQQHEWILEQAREILKQETYRVLFLSENFLASLIANIFDPDQQRKYLAGQVVKKLQRLVGVHPPSGVFLRYYRQATLELAYKEVVAQVLKSNPGPEGDRHADYFARYRQYFVSRVAQSIDIH